jgi:hypothetical protein
VSEEDAKRWIEQLGITDRSVEDVQSTLYSENLKLYAVQNTASNSAYVLAEDSNLARVIAVRAGFARTKTNVRVRELGEQFFDKNSAFGSAVRRAIRDGTPGIVKRHDNHAMINGIDCPPLHSIK